MKLVPICGYNSFHNFGKDICKILGCVCGNFSPHSFKRAFIRSDTEESFGYWRNPSSLKTK